MLKIEEIKEIVKVVLSAEFPEMKFNIFISNNKFNITATEKEKDLYDLDLSEMCEDFNKMSVDDIINIVVETVNHVNGLEDNKKEEKVNIQDLDSSCISSHLNLNYSMNLHSSSNDDTSKPEYLNDSEISNIIDVFNEMEKAKLKNINTDTHRTENAEDIKSDVSEEEEISFSKTVSGMLLNEKDYNSLKEATGVFVHRKIFDMYLVYFKDKNTEEISQLNISCEDLISKVYKFADLEHCGLKESDLYEMLKANLVYHKAPYDVKIINPNDSYNTVYMCSNGDINTSALTVFYPNYLRYLFSMFEEDFLIAFKDKSTVYVGLTNNVDEFKNIIGFNEKEFLSKNIYEYNAIKNTMIQKIEYRL